MVNDLPAVQEIGFKSWIGKIPWRKEWLPTPVFLPGEFHGQRSLAGYSPWGCKQSDTTEQLSLSFPFSHYIHLGLNESLVDQVIVDFGN